MGSHVANVRIVELGTSLHANLLVWSALHGGCCIVSADKREKQLASAEFVPETAEDFERAVILNSSSDSTY
jgi:hypothetical protein